MVLLIDNYDSFTFNLARYFEEIGEQVVVVRNDEIDLQGIAELAPDCLVFSPGPCTPDSSGVTLEAIREFHHNIPMLGVCLGHQAIAQVFGAKVERASRVMHGKVSQISHNNRGIFQGIPSTYQVTRYHSLVVASDSLPECFDITAWVKKDGDNAQDQHQEIMAIEHKNLPIYGVQFHPESLLTEHGHQLLGNFIAIAKANSKQ